MRRSLTIYDIARMAGVSFGTVSRVLNNRSDVSPDTARRVMQVIERVGYRPSRIARGLTTKRYGAVGVILPPARYFARDPFVADLLHGIASQASSLGANAVLMLQPKAEEDPLSQAFVDGFVVVGDGTSPAAQRALIASGLPVVVVNRTWNDANVITVHVDSKGGMRQVARHLEDLGHRYIGALLLDNQNGLEKLRGLQEGFTRSDTALRTSVVGAMEPAFWSADFARRIRALVDDGVSAIVCHSDLMALSVLDWCRENGVRVPRTLSVVGFDDAEFARAAVPPLTTVRAPIQKMGEQAVQLLMSRIEGTEVPQHTVFECSFVVRESTAAPPA